MYIDTSLYQLTVSLCIDFAFFKLVHCCNTSLKRTKCAINFSKYKYRIWEVYELKINEKNIPPFCVFGGHVFSTVSVCLVLFLNTAKYNVHDFPTQYSIRVNKSVSFQHLKLVNTSRKDIYWNQRNLHVRFKYRIFLFPQKFSLQIEQSLPKNTIFLQSDYWVTKPYASHKTPKYQHTIFLLLQRPKKVLVSVSYYW